MDHGEIRTKLGKTLSREKKQLHSLALLMHGRPETAFKEFKTSQLLIRRLRQKGFKVETGLAGLKTSFRAVSMKSGTRPAIGFLAELDALPELGHACGHNLIAGSSVAAAIILRETFPDLAGSIEVIGCPAEERGGGKVILNNAGVFDDLDFAIAVHPSNRTEVYKLSLALIEVKLEFIGKSAHAAAAPEKGVNALDAAIQTFNALNVLRRRLGRFARVNGIITEGGKAPNIIPDRASAEFWVRDDRMEKALSHAALVKKTAQAAAKSVGGKVIVKINRGMAYAPFLPSRRAGEIFWRIFEGLGVRVNQGDEKSEMGSTDLGNLSWKVPALHPTIKICGDAPHSTGFAKAAGSGRGLAMMDKAGLAMAMLGFRVMTDPELRREMKQELLRSKSKS